MTTLITGGAGFVGRHVAQALARRGSELRILDLDTSGLDPALRDHAVHGSVLDTDLLARALEGAHTVIHAAANPHLWARDKQIFEALNHQGTRSLLDAARAAGVKRVVHVSSLTVLVGQDRTARTVTEAHDPGLEEMQGPYCRSKWLAERAALAANARDFKVTAVLPTLPVGPGDRALTGPTRMILDLVNGKTPALIDCMHNLIDVRDLADGILAAAEHGRGGERYLLGHENLTMRDLADRLARLTGLPMPKQTVPYALALAAGHVEEWLSDHLTRRPPTAPLTGVRLAGRPLRFDTSKARAELGLAPRALDDSLSDALQWFEGTGLLTRPVPGLSALKDATAAG